MQENGELVNKSLRIRKDQEDWLRVHAINFTELVRKLLDAYIAEQDAPRRNGNAHREVAEATA